MVAVERTGIGHYSRPASVLAVVDDEQVALETRLRGVAAGTVAVERTGIGHYSRPASVLAVVDDEQVVALEIVVAVDAERQIGNVAAEWQN